MLEAFGHLTRTTIGGRRLCQGLNKPCQVPQGLPFGAEDGQGTRMQSGQKALTRTGPAPQFLAHSAPHHSFCMATCLRTAGAMPSEGAPLGGGSGTPLNTPKEILGEPVQKVISVGLVHYF